MTENRTEGAPEEKAGRRARIMETALRDAHQSLIATRMSTRDMIPVLERMDAVGYWALEMWGGATFDSCMRFLDEDPWERLRVIRSRIKNTKLHHVISSAFTPLPVSCNVLPCSTILSLTVPCGSVT